MSSSSKVAICGITASLSFVCMMFTGLISIGTYALPALAGLFLIIPNVEISTKWAVATYFVISLLSIFVVSDKEAAIMFVLFFGYYPILKGKIEKINNKVIQFLLKLLIFNFSVVSCFFIAVNLIGIPKNSFEIFGVYLPFVFLFLGNIIFILYDYALRDIFKLYTFKFHKYMDKIFK